MLHRLLACLALLTGLTMLSAPAHARDTGVVATQVEQQAVTGAARIVAMSAAAGPADGTMRSSSCQPCTAAPRAAPAVTVWVGSDRAHE